MHITSSITFFGKLTLVFILLIIAGNVLVLNYFVIRLNRQSAAHNVALEENIVKDISSGQIQVTCDADCQAQIDEKIKDATSSLKQINSTSNAPSSSATSSSSQVESYVPFGGGNVVNSNGWTNVTGLAANVDNTKFGNIQQVFFEASVFVPTGNQTVSVRLFDVTAGHPVWYSDVSMDGGQPQFLVSQPITLDPGNNLYQVQMNTSLTFQANLSQARLRIVSIQ